MIANSKLPPFLPDPKFVSKEAYEKIYNSLNLMMRTENTVQFTKIHERDEKLTGGKSSFSLCGLIKKLFKIMQKTLLFLQALLILQHLLNLERYLELLLLPKV